MILLFCANLMPIRESIHIHAVKRDDCGPIGTETQTHAGIAKFAPIAQVDEAFYDSQFKINVKGAFFLVKHAIPVIPDGGAIILTASVAGANGGTRSASARRVFLSAPPSSSRPSH